MPYDHDTKTWSHSGKILCSTDRVGSKSRWSKTSNVLWARCMTPTVLSTKLGIIWWKNSDYLSGMVITTYTHDNFECPSPRAYVDIKSWLAYEQNPYSTCWVRSTLGWIKTLHALWIRSTPPTTLTIESWVNKLENPNCLEWLGISYLGSTIGSISDQVYASGHELFGPWCYELSHYAGCTGLGH
jgi:hypothetical protein